MKILLLNNSFSCLDFISERKAIKLIVKDKVDVLSVWAGETFDYDKGSIPLPAVLRMRYPITRKAIKLIFSRNAIFVRDKYQCQYCEKSLTSNTATIDHIVPKSRGGKNDFTNCVTSCQACNRLKGQQSLDRAKMKLIRNPIVPKGYLMRLPEDKQHPSWDLFMMDSNEIDL